MNLNRYVRSTFRAQNDMILDYLNDIGLQPGGNCMLRIDPHREHWNGKDSTQNIEVEVDFKKLTPEQRRDLKRAVALEVPSYAMGGTYKEPPLHGEVECKIEEESGVWFTLNFQFMVSGAYVCKPVGKVLKPPSEWQKEEAMKLNSMSEDEILKAHRERVASMLKPQERDAYECAPSK